MTDVFIEKIKKNKIKTPVSMGFKIDKWRSEWHSSATSSNRCEEVYRAGEIIHEILQGVRKELGELYSKRPEISDERLLVMYIALSNRDRAIMSDSVLIDREEIHHVLSATTSLTMSGNEVSLDELANGCVDGIQKAIANCKKRLNSDKKGSNEKGSNDGVRLIDFVMKESALSQIYDFCEGYWQAIIWNEYRFNEVDKDLRLYSITQRDTDLEFGYMISQNRKLRQSAQTFHTKESEGYKAIFENDRCLYIKKSGRSKQFLSKKVSDSNDKVKFINFDFRLKTLNLYKHFPEEFIHDNCDAGFNIKEALDVFRCLNILSSSCMDMYPIKDDFKNLNKLAEFCPKFNKVQITTGLAKATGYSYGKVVAILKFLEFDGSKSKDLWCYPIVSIGGEYALMTSSLITPVLIRVVEHWLVELKIDLQSKGKTYEDRVLDSINRAVSKNELITDYDNGVSKRLKLETGEEEIDLLIRIGNVIVLGEAKSIVTTDSPISQYRTIGTLKKAAEQVSRKKKFVEENIHEIFNRLNWTFDEDANYKIEGCIINSSQVYVGVNVEGIPVCDNEILVKYFTDNIVPLMSVSDEHSDGAKHIAWYSLYENFNELQENIGKYLISPPQLSESSTDFQYKDSFIPSITESSPHLFYRRFIPLNVSMSDKLKKKTNFKLNVVDDIDSILEKVGVII